MTVFRSISVYVRSVCEVLTNVVLSRSATNAGVWLSSELDYTNVVLVHGSMRLAFLCVDRRRWLWGVYVVSVFMFLESFAVADALHVG